MILAGLCVRYSSARQKDNGLRLYINYYRLNKVIIKNQHLLLFTNKTLDRLINTKILIKVNLKNTYYYI
jgi:hypothetical protein